MCAINSLPLSLRMYSGAPFISMALCSARKTSSALDRPIRPDAMAFPRVFVDEVKCPHGSSSLGIVADKVPRPYMIAMCWPSAASPSKALAAAVWACLEAPASPPHGVSAAPASCLRKTQLSQLRRDLLVAQSRVRPRHPHDFIFQPSLALRLHLWPIVQSPSTDSQPPAHCPPGTRQRGLYPYSRRSLPLRA